MKRKLLVSVGALVAAFVLTMAGFFVWVKMSSDPTFDLPPTGLQASTDPALIAEGEYLFHGPMHCTACHDSSKEVAMKRTAGEKIDPIGGMVWDMEPMATPVSANLTSDVATGLGGKSDEHIAKVLKHGVGEDGKLRIFMALATPSMSDHEVVALLSYMRTIPPQEHAVPPEHIGLVGEVMIALGAFQPKSRAPATYVAPTAEPDVSRGEYLATGAGLCSTCHSPYDFMDEMKLKGELFTGCLAAEPGHDDPSIEYCAPNLTPDETAGHIGQWDEERFVARLRSGAFTGPETPMPWVNYSNMTDTDLRSIYRYLRTLPPSPRNPGPPMRGVGTFEMPEH